MTGLEAAIGGILARVLYLVLLVHIDLLAVVLRKVWRGDNVFDRLMGADLLGTLIVAVLVLVASLRAGKHRYRRGPGPGGAGLYRDHRLAKYVADEQMF